MFNYPNYKLDLTKLVFKIKLDNFIRDHEVKYILEPT